MGSPAETLFGPIRDAANRSGLAEFLAWWRDELAAMVPAGWRERFSSRGMAYVALDGDHWRVSRLTAGGLVEAGRASVSAFEGADRRASFRRLVAGAVAGASNVWLMLPRAEVLVRKAALPLAAEEALRDALGFELDRLTPLAAEQACFDCRVIGRDAAAQALELQIAASARGPIEARVAQLRELGANVLGVGVEGDLGSAAVPFNLLAPESRDRPAISRMVVVARALALLTAFLAVLALAYPLWQKREAVIDLQPRLDRAKASADVADRLAQEIEKLAAEHNFVVSRKQGQYPAVVLLEDLSRLLPDTTWVQQLDIKAGPKIRELQIAGETGSSSQLVEVLEKSGSLVNANFKSPLTKGVTPGTERFLIAAEVKPRALPEPMPESSLRVSPTAAPESRQAANPAQATPAAVAGPAPEAPAAAAAGGTVPAGVPAGPSPATPVTPAAAPKGGESKATESKGSEPATPVKPAVKG